MKSLETDLLGACTEVRVVRPRRRLYRAVVTSLAGLVLLAGIFYFARDPFLNRYLRPGLEQAFAAHFPGSSLRLGPLHHDLWGNRLRCDGLDLTLRDGAPARLRSLSVQGVPWARLLAGEHDPWPLFRAARIEVSEISAKLPSGDYGVRCGHLRISVPDAEITARDITYEPTISDDAFFAADAFRRVRYRFAVASCTAHGVGFAELLHGQAYRVQSLELRRPVIESFVDREKPRRSPAIPPLMPHEVLGAIARPFRVDRLALTDGEIRCAGRRFEGAEPGLLIFTAVRITAQDIANAAAGGRDIGIQAQGRLMDAGELAVHVSIPAAASALTFHYSGNLGTMDLTPLDEYLVGTGGFKISSGRASGASFDIDVVDGHARGALRGIYRDLQVKVLDRETGSEKGVTPRVATILANQLKVRHENTPEAGASREGKVDYARKPEDSFLQFGWLAVRTGIVDLVSL